MLNHLGFILIFLLHWFVLVIWVYVCGLMNNKPILVQLIKN